MKQAAAYRESHTPEIRVACGRWVAMRYIARIKMELCEAAIRERRFGAGVMELGRRLIALPVLFPSDWARLAKAAIRAITG